MLCGSLFLCPFLVELSSDLSLVVGFSSMLVFLDQLCFVFYVGFGYFWGGRRRLWSKMNDCWNLDDQLVSDLTNFVLLLIVENFI